MAEAKELDRKITRFLETGNNAALLKLLVEQDIGGDVVIAHLPNAQRFRLLGEVIRRGWTDAALHLIEHGADLTKRDAGRTPLIEACAQKHHPIIEALLARKVDVNARASKGAGETDNTALMEAAEKGDVWAVRRLIGAGADVNVLNCRKQSAVGVALVPQPSEGRNAVVDELLQAGCRLVGVELHLPIYRRDVAMTRRLLEHGGPLNEPFVYNEYAGPKKGMTPLTCAVGWVPSDTTDEPAIGLLPTAEQRVQIVHLLLSHGADPNAGSTNGQTPLMLAVNLKDARITRMLVEAGADPDHVPANTKMASPAATARKVSVDEIVKLFESRKS